LDNPILHAEIIDEAKTTALQILEVCQLSRETCERLWLEFDDEYFLRHSADEIAWHTQSILQGGIHSVPRVVIRQTTARGSTEIFIYTRDHNHLFAHITTVLSRLGLNILDARIITTHAGYTHDTFMVLGESGKPITEDYRIDEITGTLLELLRDPHQTPQEVSRRASRKVKHFNVPTNIHFGNDPKSNTTGMELITADHPGLLSKVGKAFIESKVLVNNARITTIGAQAEDMFYITGLDRQPINDQLHQKRIRESILKHLNELTD
jgi:[protein-PII] uridylyltransferase